MMQPNSRIFGFPDVRLLLREFVRVSHLVPHDSPLHPDVRQFALGKRRFYASFESAKKAKDVVDFPALCKRLEEELARSWLTPSMSRAIFSRLEHALDEYLTGFVHEISGAALPTARLVEILRPTFLAQRLAVDLSWLEQNWGVGLLRKLLPQTQDEPKPIAVALRWFRRLEGRSQKTAAQNAKLEPVDVLENMNNWETGSVPRRDSFPMLRALYGLETNERYRLWFWIALCLSELDEQFRREIANCIGRPFNFDDARMPTIEATNAAIIQTPEPPSFKLLDMLLCRQSHDRKAGDRELALQALDELKRQVTQYGGLAEYHVPAMAGRIALFSEDFIGARDHFIQAVELCQYQEPKSVERILREAAAVFDKHGFLVPLKNVTDLQWLMGVHPVQIRRSAWDDDDTWESIVDNKRMIDYYRYFPPQLFFARGT